MAGDAVAEVKSRLDLIEVIGGYVTLHRAGRELTGLCPFHPRRRRPSRSAPSARSGTATAATRVATSSSSSSRSSASTSARRSRCWPTGPGSSSRAVPPLAARGVAVAAPSSSTAKRRPTTSMCSGPRPPASPAACCFASAESTRRSRARSGSASRPAGGAGEDALARYLTGKGGATVDELVDAGLVHPQRGGRVRDRFRDRLVFPIRDERG